MTNTRYAGLLLAGLLTACGGSSSSTPANTVTETPTVEPAPIAIGKAGIRPGVTVTINSVKEESQIGEKGYGPEAQPGETFIVVRYTIKNTSNKPLSSLDQPDLELVDGSSQSYAEDTQASVLAAALNNDILDGGGDLNPQVTAKNTAVWKIAKAPFDKKTWRIKVTIGGLTAKFDKAASWPVDSGDAPAPLIFSLQ